MSNEQIVHDLAINYAKVKLSEYEMSQREQIMSGNEKFSKEELSYFKSAYDFAKENIT